MHVLYRQLGGRGVLLRPRLVQDPEFGEVFAVEAPIAREEPVGLSQRMRTDQEISGHPLAAATPRPILAPGRALTGIGTRRAGQSRAESSA